MNSDNLLKEIQDFFLQEARRLLVENDLLIHRWLRFGNE
jgi:hypothetical protein